MNRPDEKQIWDEVFRGNVSHAIDLTKEYRNTHRSPRDFRRTGREPVALHLEPSLTSNIGHQLNLANCYKQEFEKLGFHTIVAHSQNNLLPSQADWRPYFLVKHHTMASGKIDSLPTMEKVAAYFLAEFSEVILEHDPMVCVFPTIRFTNVIGAAQAVARHKVKFAFFGVMEAEEVPDCDDDDIIHAAFSRASSLLQKSQVPHLVIAETDHVRSFLLRCGFHEESVKVFPYVAASRITDIPSLPERDTGKIRVGYLGGSRPVRCPELIADLVVANDLPESVDLRVQLDLGYIGTKRDADVCEMIRTLDKSGQIRLYPANLGDQEYRSLFCSLDLVLMPYTCRYEQIGSGVFCEAVYAGVTPVLMADSQLSRLYTSLGGSAPRIRELSRSAIENAVMDGVMRVAALQEEAVLVRKKWRQQSYSAEQWQAELKKLLSPYAK